MLIVQILAIIAHYLLLIYFFVMWARFVLDLVQMFSREWRPRGVGLVLAETSYALTDPPIRFFRRLVPRVSFGQVALDFGWSLTMFAVIIGLYLTLAIMG